MIFELTSPLALCLPSFVWLGLRLRKHLCDIYSYRGNYTYLYRGQVCRVSFEHLGPCERWLAKNNNIDAYPHPAFHAHIHTLLPLSLPQPRPTPIPVWAVRFCSGAMCGLKIESVIVAHSQTHTHWQSAACWREMRLGLPLTRRLLLLLLPCRMRACVCWLCSYKLTVLFNFSALIRLKEACTDEANGLMTPRKIRATSVNGMRTKNKGEPRVAPNSGNGNGNSNDNGKRQTAIKRPKTTAKYFNPIRHIIQQ